MTFRIVVQRRDDRLRSDENVVADCDASLVLELAARVNEHALADLRVLAAVRVERREETERLVDLARRQLRHERTHFLGRMIRAVQLSGDLQRLLRECVKRPMKFTPSGNVLHLGHRLSEFIDSHLHSSCLLLTY